MVSCPPIAETRSVMLVSPVPTVAGSNPGPVSLIVRLSCLCVGTGGDGDSGVGAAVLGGIL